MSSDLSFYILRLQCADCAGIVAAVATTLSNHECNIEDSAQFHEPESEQFFMRVVLSTHSPKQLNMFKENFKQLASRFGMQWQLDPVNQPVKTMVLVSQYDHCLNALLYRAQDGHLPIDITAIVSNHDKAKGLADHYNTPFHYLPVTPKNKKEQEQQIRDLIDKTGTELIVLARYMQILSGDFCDDFRDRIINIHHSFLPGFKGARPYHQAYERGVKIIGATAHYVTQDLDEGPIIAQGVISVDHAHTPAKMQRVGQDSEARVLTQAVGQYAERRIFRFGNRTIIL